MTLESDVRQLTETLQEFVDEDRAKRKRREPVTTILQGHDDLHRVKDSEPFCKDCGEKNPFFKDETECEDCHRPLGSIKAARNLGSCTGPECGSTNVKVKLGRYVKCADCEEPLAATPEEAKQLSECPDCGGSSAVWSDDGGGW